MSNKKRVCPQELKHDDKVTGHRIEIRYGQNFTVFSVSGRDYYFRRDDGSFDGTGSCLNCGYAS